MTSTVSQAHPIQVEHLVVRLRRHARALTLPVLLLLATAAAAGFWVGTFPEAWMNVTAAAGAVLLALLLGVGPLVSWLASRTLVTTRRIIVRRGLFVQHRSELSLARVREVRTRRTLWQRAFGSGNIELAAGVDEPTVLRDVPSCLVVAEALRILVEQNFAQATSRSEHSDTVPALPLTQPVR